MLLLLSRWAPAPASRPTGTWTSAVVLALYAMPFSFAYIGLSTGTGALILFGCVQVTMMAGALRSGERPVASQWLGIGLALVGLVYLVLPGIAAPPPLSAGLMALAGMAWGIYALRGRGAVNPLAQTTSAFVRSVPLALALSAISFRQFHAGVGGVALGVCAAEAQAAGQDGSGVCGDVADWGHDGLGRGVADESGWLGGRREGRAGVPRSFHRRDGVGHGALRRPGGCAAA